MTAIKSIEKIRADLTAKYGNDTVKIDRIVKSIESSRKNLSAVKSIEKAIEDRKITREKSENSRSFPDLVSDFNNSDPDRDPVSYEKSLTDISTATTFCVLKKCIDPTRNNKGSTVSNAGYNPVMVSLKSDTNTDRLMFENFNNAVKNITYHTEYNKNGDPVKICDTPDLEKIINKSVHEQTVGEGMDLIHDCVVAMLEETARQKLRDPKKTLDIERPYTVHRLKKKVYIKKVDSVGGYETVETRPITESFKAVRRSIENSRAVQADPRNGYIYLNGLMNNPDGETDDIYIRLPKYADLGGYVRNFNDAETVYTADNSALETLETIENLTCKLKPTQKQQTILNLRLCGYGNKAISTYLGVSADNIKGQIKELRRKAIKAGFNPDPTPEKTPDPTPEKTPTPVTLEIPNGHIINLKNSFLSAYSEKLKKDKNKITVRLKNGYKVKISKKSIILCYKHGIK